MGAAPEKTPPVSTPAPSTTTPPPTEAPSYSTEPTSSSDYYAPEASAPAVVEEPVAAPRTSSPAPTPEPAPAPARPDRTAPVDVGGATALSSAPPKSSESSSEAPAPAAALPSPGGESDSGSSYVGPLLVILALCVLGLAGVQLRRYLRHREIEAVRRERAATWDAVVQQIEVRRSLGSLEPAPELQELETPDRSAHIAA